MIGALGLTSLGLAMMTDSAGRPRPASAPVRLTRDSVRKLFLKASPDIRQIIQANAGYPEYELPTGEDLAKVFVIHELARGPEQDLWDADWELVYNDDLAALVIHGKSGVDPHMEWVWPC